MNEKEIVEQIVSREISNILGSINPAFRMFSPTVTKYTMNFLSPYIDAFTDPDTNKINTAAASEYLKQETSEKIEKFMKTFNDQHGNKL